MYAPAQSRRLRKRLLTRDRAVAGSSQISQESLMSKLFQRIQYACLFLAAIFTLPAVAFAQSTRGELAGNITDTTGALVPGAKVVVVNTETGATSETVSTSSGL